MAPSCGASLDANQPASGFAAEIHTFSSTQPSLAGRNFVGGCHATEFRPHLILAPGSLLGYALQVKLGGEAGAH